MKQYIPLVFLTFLLFGCGDSQDSSESLSSQTQQFSIQRGPSNSELFSIAQKMRLEFSAPLDASTVNSNTVYLQELFSIEEPPFTVGSYTGITEGTNKIYVTPYTYLRPSSTYQIVVTTGVKDIDGRSLANDYVYPFTTDADSVDSSSFGIRSLKPGADETDVLVNVDIVVDFNATLSEEAAYSGTNYLSVSYVDVNGTSQNVSGLVEVFNSLLKFIPNSQLPYDTNITVNLDPSIQNIYGTTSSVSLTSYSFRTRTQESSPRSSGFYDINTTQTGVASSALSKYGSRFIVARTGGIDMYEINYTDSLPNATKLSSFVIDSSITSMQMDANYILLSTIGNGIYLLSYQENGTVTLVQNSLLGESVFSVRFGESSSSRVYAAGPKFGVEIFDFNATTNILTSLYEINTSVVGTALDVVEVEKYDNIASADVKKLYIADYMGSMVILDINGSYQTKVDLNSSIKRFTFNETYDGKSGIFAISSSGKVQGLGFDGAIYSNVKTDLPGTISSVYSHVEEFGASNLYYSNFNQGIIKTSGDYIDEIILTGGSVVASAYVDAEGNSVDQTPPGYLITLNSDGKLGFYNAVSDLEGPSISLSYEHPTSTILDANITLSLSDAYLDESQIVADKFTLYDLNSTTPQNPISLSFSKALFGSTDLGITLDPDDNVTDGHTYSIVITSTFSDKFGNMFNGGNDFNTTFTVEK